MDDPAEPPAQRADDSAPDLSAGEESLKLVLACFAARRSGSIYKTDLAAHATLQAMRGYEVLKSGVPGAEEFIARYYPRLYTLVSRVHEELAEGLSRYLDEG